MIKNLNWYKFVSVHSQDRLLCPTPFAYSDQLYVFYGQQSEVGKPAKLACSILNSDEEFKEIRIEYTNPKEHACSLGNLPNYVHLRDKNEIILICAEFYSSIKHKHRLIAHSHKLVFMKDKIRIFPRENFQFLADHSEEFHTLAGMSFFKDEYFVAEGKEWFVNAQEMTPVTSMTRYVGGGHEKSILPFPKAPYEIAHARPIMTNFHNLEIFAYSIRYSNSDYGSALFCREIGEFERVEQKFWIKNQLFEESELAYLFPFQWKKELWCIVTRDFRGTLGFELFRGVLSE